MVGLKRFVMIVFAVAGAVLVTALILPWTGPWTEQFASYLAIPWYLYVAEILALIAYVGFLVVFVRACALRRHKDVVVHEADGERVTIARSAIASQAVYIVEEDGTCIARKVIVDVRRNTVSVKISVQPERSLNVQDTALRLQDELRSGLTVLCGETLGSITLRFIEPRVAEAIPAVQRYEREDGIADQDDTAPANQPAVRVDVTEEVESHG